MFVGTLWSVDKYKMYIGDVLTLHFGERNFAVVIKCDHFLNSLSDLVRYVFFAPLHFSFYLEVNAKNFLLELEYQSCFCFVLAFYISAKRKGCFQLL